ncbi:MAG TPA: M23 family metallopeptidase [Saprospiraceae bacterium]|nr:M23 family metallopeptidase [Saprospiraceae bacterium]MCB9328463.1 M23 family metallopeptidase [Lewinellaceae bacterium]HRX28109.1 M23 family metallopeptidase [Saprospiraceae bacterium]
MKKEKYVYNERTLQFEKLRLSPQEILIQIGKNVLSVLLVAAGLSWVVYRYMPSPREVAQERELKQLNYYVNALNADVSNMSELLDGLHERDGSVNRIIFGMDPIDENIWNGGTGGHNKYSQLENYGNTGAMLSTSLQKADLLMQKMDIQKKSLDTIYNLAMKRENRLASIPSIKPVRSDLLKHDIHALSGYGIRLHPVHKVKKLHKGLDFTAPEGTAIQATGDGKVTKIEHKSNGYGNYVIIDHGYGYKSLYAHMKKIEVKLGETVVKGQEIGKVGSTGTSTAPHCHYEVLVNGKSVNPIDYCLDGLSPEEYKELVEKASQENQSFD